MTPAIAVHGLQKSYGDVHAVRGIDFEVRQGEVFGLLGPQRSRQNHHRRNSRRASPTNLRRRQGARLRPRRQRPRTQRPHRRLPPGHQPPDQITVREAVDLFAAFYSRSTDPKRLLERLQLWEKRDAYYKTLSGGQKQRVALALAMVNEPQLLFLDEPTTGLDPQVRHEIHGLIKEQRDAKTSIILTTHYIEEAEQLCDRVAIIDQGKIIEIGTPREIQQRVLGDSMIQLTVTTAFPAEIPKFSDESRRSLEGATITLHSGKPARTLVDAVKWVDATGLEIGDVRLKHPTLEDVFIELTGKKLRE